MRGVGGAPEPLLVEVGDGVALLCLNRPARRNAVDRALGAELEATLDRLGEDDTVRVVVLTGAGPAFCAGADLKDPRPADVSSVLSGRAARLTEAVDRFPKPVIAAVNGAAYGGGCELALAADLRIASTTATFCLPEVRIGSLPGSGGTHRLAAAVGGALAAKMILTGEPITAEVALRAGLVSDVFPDESLRGEALGLAQRIAANAPLSLLAAKQALAGAGGESGRQLERLLWSLLATTKDRAEGRAAFSERRPPSFRGE